MAVLGEQNVKCLPLKVPFSLLLQNKDIGYLVTTTRVSVCLSIRNRLVRILNWWDNMSHLWLIDTSVVTTNTRLIAG